MNFIILSISCASIDNSMLNGSWGPIGTSEAIRSSDLNANVQTKIAFELQSYPLLVCQCFWSKGFDRFNTCSFEFTGKNHLTCRSSLYLCLFLEVRWVPIGSLWISEHCQKYLLVYVRLHWIYKKFGAALQMFENTYVTHWHLVSYFCMFQSVRMNSR